MSDTPRTDAEAFIVNMTGNPDDMGAELCTATFARELERELNEAKSEIDRLNQELRDQTDYHNYDVHWITKLR